MTTFRNPDGGFSPHYLEARARIERLGFLVVPVVGGDVAFWSARMKTRVHESGICFLHVRELVLPLVDAARPGFLVAEDDACFHESFTFDAFASVPMDPQSSSVTMVRSHPSKVDRSMAPRRNDGARASSARHK